MEAVIPPDIDRKLVVLSGPRQCGKTTLAKKMVRERWGKDLSLRYFRHGNGKEVDFVLVLNRKPHMAIEAKLADSSLSPSLKYYLERVKLPYPYQVVLERKNERTLEPINGAKVRIVSAARFLANLP
ncbi:MAG: hypothetical protein U1F27_02960 [Turneriella sp.]